MTDACTFTALLPEMLEEIRGFLPIFARVRLQRSCKLMQALDPGAFMPPVWQEAYDKVAESRVYLDLLNVLLEEGIHLRLTPFEIYFGSVSSSHAGAVSVHWLQGKKDTTQAFRSPLAVKDHLGEDWRSTRMTVASTWKEESIDIVDWQGPFIARFRWSLLTDTSTSTRISKRWDSLKLLPNHEQAGRAPSGWFNMKCSKPVQAWYDTW
jgi:hypothetical protein